MAKAATQARRGRPAPGAKQGTRTAPAAKARTRRPGTWTKVLALIILSPFAAVLLPTTLVFVIMMAPTWVAYVTDRSRDKHLALSVGMLNFAGTLPAIIELWSRGQSHPTAMLLIGDVFVWAAAYGAAAFGWGIFAVMPTLVGGFHRMTTEARIKGLVDQQKALIAEWSGAVAEGLAPTMADDEASDPDEEEADDAEVTEAAVVGAPRAR